jgi:hypothetical protein
MEIKMKTAPSLIIVFVLLCGCGATRGVRQSDLDLWVGVPVVALDTQSFFLTLPMIKTATDTGVEIRDYVNKRNISGCYQSSFGNVTTPANTVTYAYFNRFQQCSSAIVGCDNIFYIRDGKVIEYRPTGRCYTDETVQPQAGWKKFLKQ